MKAARTRRSNGCSSLPLQFILFCSDQKVMIFIEFDCDNFSLYQAEQKNQTAVPNKPKNRMNGNHSGNHPGKIAKQLSNWLCLQFA